MSSPYKPDSSSPFVWNREVRENKQNELFRSLQKNQLVQSNLEKFEGFLL